MAFSAGLVCFTYSSSQGRLATTCATVFTAFAAAILLAVSLWFAVEGVDFARTKCGRFLVKSARFLKRTFSRANRENWLSELKRAARWSRNRLTKLGCAVRTTPSTKRLSSLDNESQGRPNDVEEHAGHHDPILPLTNSLASHRSGFPDPTGKSFPDSGKMIVDTVQQRLPDSDSTITEHPTSGPLVPPFPLHSKTPSSSEAAGSTSTPHVQSISVVHSIGGAKATRIRKSAEAGGRTPRMSSSPDQVADSAGRVQQRDNSYALEHPHIDVVSSALKRLTPTQVLTEHRGVVPDMQFSPNGTFLATCSWDRNAVIWTVGSNTITPLHVLPHWSGSGFIHQVAWSPDGNYLITRMPRVIQVWSARVCNYLEL